MHDAFEPDTRVDRGAPDRRPPHADCRPMSAARFKAPLARPRRAAREKAWDDADPRRIRDRERLA